MNDNSEDAMASAPDVKALEAQLAVLVPCDDRLDRDRLMYLAGQASVRAAGEEPPRSRRLRWAAPASLGAAVGALAASLLMTALAPQATPSAPAGAAPRVELAETVEWDGGRSFDASEWRLARLIDASAELDAELTAAGLIRNARMHREAASRDAAVVVDASPPAGSRPLTSRSVEELLAAPAGSNRSS